MLFTFTGAESRLEYRRELITGAANSISTAYARIDLLSAKAQPQMRNMLKEYTLIRAQIYQGQENLSDENKLSQASDQLQNRSGN